MKLLKHNLKTPILSLLISICLGFSVNAQKIQPKLRLPIGHTNGLLSAHFSPDGKSIVTASRDETAKIWDVASGKMIHDLTGHTSRVRSAHFSPDGKSIVTASYDYTAKIWEVTSGKMLHNLSGHTSWVNSAQFSPDGKSIVTASGDGTAKIWDVASGNMLHDLTGHTDYVHSAQFSPDGKSIVTASRDNTAKIWDVASGNMLHDLTGHTDRVYTAHFSPDGKSIVTVSLDYTIKIWEVASGNMLHDLSGHTDDVQSAQFSPDGKSIVTASEDNTAKIWEVASGKMLRVLRGQTSIVWTAQFSPDGKSIVTASHDNTAKIWEVASGNMLRSLRGQTGIFQSAQFSPDGKSIVTASVDSTAKIWEVASGNMLYNLTGHKWSVQSAQFSPDGKSIVTASLDNTAKIWEIASGEMRQDLTGHMDGVQSAQFSPDGEKIVTASWDNTAKIWEVASGKKLRNLTGHTSSVYSAQFSPDGKSIVTASKDGTAKIWEVASGNRLHDLTGHTDDVISAQFSPDGKSIVTTSDDYTAKIWEAASGNMLHDLTGHTDRVWTAHFSPDGKSIVTASYDNTAKIWEVASGALIKDLDLNGLLLEVNFDGNTLISHNNSMLTLWDMETGEELYSWIAIDRNDYLVIDPYGRYDGTEAARDYLYFVCNDEIIDLAQMKDALYVPGLVEKINSGQAINYPKLSELDICDALPLIEQIENEGENYHYKITPRRLGLEKVELYVNNKRVFTIPTNKLVKDGDVYFLKIAAEEITQHFLAGAENTVNVIGIARTAEGSELKSRGVKRLFSSEEKTSASPPKLFAVMIGVNDYKDAALNLNYPVKDAQDLGKTLDASASKLLGEENVFIYKIHSDVKTNNGFTTPEKEGVRRALEEIGKKAKPEDIILMFFAGHGVMQGAEEKLFTFLTAEASNLNQTGINTKELQEWLSYEGPNKILANKTVLIFDACNSGQATQELMALARNDDDTRRTRQVEDLKDKSGMFILAASAPNQSAYELPQYEQGLLTYSLLSVLKNNPVILDDGQFLNVQKWFLESEKYLKQLVESHGYEQNAQPFGSANIRIGLVDEEVKNSIQLAKEKPLLICANVLNSETFNDDLQLKKLVNKELSFISERGSNSEVIFARQETKGANKINIIYQYKGEKVTCQIRLLKEGEELHQASIIGNKNDMDELVSNIIDEVVGYAR